MSSSRRLLAHALRSSSNSSLDNHQLATDANTSANAGTRSPPPSMAAHGSGVSGSASLGVAAAAAAPTSGGSFTSAKSSAAPPGSPGSFRRGSIIMQRQTSFSSAAAAVAAAAAARRTRPLHGVSLWLFPPTHPLRARVARAVRHRHFDNAVLALILMSAVLLALDSPLQDPTSERTRWLARTDLVLTVLFTLEMALKVFVFGFALHPEAYLRDPWNVLDFVIVITALAAEVLSGFSQLRALKSLRAARSLRPLRAVSRSAGLRLVVSALLQSIPPILNVVMITLLVFFMFAVVGVSFFKGRFYACQGEVFESLAPAQVALLEDPLPFAQLNTTQRKWAAVPGASYDGVTSRAVCEWLGARWLRSTPQSFDNVLAGMSTLFEVSTTEGWPDIMRAAVDARGVGMQPRRDSAQGWVFFFVAFITLGAFFMLNLFVGVVVDTFNQLRENRTHNLDDAEQVETNHHNPGTGLAAGSAHAHPTAALATVGRQAVDPARGATSVGASALRAQYGHSHDHSHSARGSAFTPSSGRAPPAPTPTLAFTPHSTPAGVEGGVLLTDTQREWVRVQEAMMRVRPHRKPPLPRGFLRRLAFKLVSHRRFEAGIMALIVINTLSMAVNHFGEPIIVTTVTGVANVVFAVAFTLEAVLKMWALRMHYFRSGWNVFDLCVVLGTNAGIAVQWFTGIQVGTVATAVRTFRIARILRLVNRARALRVLFNTLLLTLPGLANIAALLALLLFMFAVVGMQLFATVEFGEALNEQANFRSFWRAVMTLVRCSVGEDWNALMHDVAQDDGSCVRDPSYDARLCGYSSAPDCLPLQGCGSWLAYPYFIAYVMLVTYVLLNVVVAVVLDGFSTSSGEAGAQLTEDQFTVFTERWVEYDTEATCFMPAHHLVPFFKGLPAPMGFSGEARASTPTPVPRDPGTSQDAARARLLQAVAELDLPTYVDTHTREPTVFFADVAIACAKRVMTKVAMERQETLDVPVTHHVYGEWSRRYGRVKVSKARNSHSATQIFSAEAVRTTWRVYKLRSQYAHLRAEAERRKEADAGAGL